jgi:hypothetical protein
MAGSMWLRGFRKEHQKLSPRKLDTKVFPVLLALIDKVSLLSLRTLSRLWFSTSRIYNFFKTEKYFQHIIFIIIIIEKAALFESWKMLKFTFSSSSCVNGGHYRLGKLHRCSEITSGSWDAPDYPTCPRTPLQ